MSRDTSKPARGRHAASPVRSARHPARRVLATAGLIVGATVVALANVGGSYALWSGSAAVNASTVSSGSTGLTINGKQSAPLALNLAALAPGTGVSTPLTVANVGSAPLNVTVAKTTVTSDSKSLATELTAVLTPVASANACTAGLGGGTSARLSSFSTTAPLAVAAGASAVWCLEVILDADAPATVQGGSTAFTLAVSALQRAA